jgi:hypothetical protein
MLACELPRDFNSDLLIRTSSASIAPTSAVRTANTKSPALWSSSRGAFPAATIGELQRWGQYLFDNPNRHVRVFWDALGVSYDGIVPLPLALPGAEADSVQLAWDTEAHHLDVTVFVDGTKEWFFMNRQTGELLDGVFPQDTLRFCQLLQMVASG